jgi:hypothetical protein
VFRFIEQRPSSDLVKNRKVKHGWQGIELATLIVEIDEAVPDQHAPLATAVSHFNRNRKVVESGRKPRWGFGSRDSGAGGC